LELANAFYGANRPGAKVSQGTLDEFWLLSMQAGAKNAYEGIKAFSETDFTEDLKKWVRRAGERMAVSLAQLQPLSKARDAGGRR
jgi:hypothetical protein